MIYAFGNSHVSIFSGTDVMVPIWPQRSIDKLPWFKTFRIGPVTAYQAFKHLDTINHIIEVVGFDKEKDTLLFVFGEVDVRAHIIGQSKEQNRSVEDITKEVVDRYYLAISTMKSIGFKVAVFGCIAGFKLKKDAQQPPWPYVGTCVERNKITKVFNDLLEQYCLDDNVPFISIFEEMLLPDWNTKVKYLDTETAGCHVTTCALPLILWKFRDIGLIPWDAKIAPYESGD